MATMVPQVAMMGVVNQFFSGFVLVKIPFPLTPSFKSMLQRGIPLASLDVTYVTSLSWSGARAPAPSARAWRRRRGRVRRRARCAEALRTVRLRVCVCARTRVCVVCVRVLVCRLVFARYFIVMFGMQGLFRLVLGGSEEDESALMMSAGMGMMPGMMPGGAMPGQPVDNKKNFEQERENLSLVEHKWALAEAEDVLSLIHI